MVKDRASLSPRPRRVVLPVGSKVCQCGGCGQVFNSLKPFDLHRAGEIGERRCLTPEEMTRVGMVKNKYGRWITEVDPRHQEEE